MPLAIADATALTEAGYIGDDIESVVSKLLAAADNDVERAEHGIIFIDEIIYALGADKVLFPYCKDYLTIILLFTPASMLQVLFQNLFVTAGKPTLGLVLSVCAGAMNIVFDYLFMVIFDMGIAGAGFGTGIGYQPLRE